jgi:hypothetical protein
MRLSYRIAVSLLLCWLVVRPVSARAEDDPAITKAKASFTQGQQLYLQEKYGEAAKAFLEAFGHKAIPAFLFNAAVAYEKAKEYVLAVEQFRKYLESAPDASDAASVRERIAALDKAIAASVAVRPPPDRPPPDGMTPPPRDTVRPRAVVVPVLPDIKPKGVVMVNTKPTGATIYLNDKLHRLGESPWQGDLPSGSHEILIEAKGYRPEKKAIQVTPDRLVDVYVGLSQEHYLGWVEVTASRPGAAIFIDRKEVGAVGRTPYTGFLNPGKHQIWVSFPGHKEQTQTVEVVSSQAHKFHFALSPLEHGWLSVVGVTAPGAEVKLDGKLVCKAPCTHLEVAPGQHVLVVERKGRKPLRTKVDVERVVVTTATVQLQPKPSRVSAYVSYGFAAGFLASGIALGFVSKQQQDDLKSDIDAGKLINTRDARFQRGRIYSYIANAMFGLTGVCAIFGVYYTFADRGPKSSIQTAVRRIGLLPEFGPSYAGLRGEVRF